MRIKINVNSVFVKNARLSNSYDLDQPESTEKFDKTAAN